MAVVSEWGDATPPMSGEYQPSPPPEVDPVELVVPPHPIINAPQRLRNSGQKGMEPSARMRPGWKLPVDKSEDICFECFQLGHKRPNCPHLSRTIPDDPHIEWVRGNSERLSPAQKAWVQSVQRTPAVRPPQQQVPSPPPKEDDRHVPEFPAKNQDGGRWKNSFASVPRFQNNMCHQMER